MAQGQAEEEEDTLAVRKKAAERPQLLSWADIKEERLNDKISRKLAVGQNEMVGRLWLAKGPSSRRTST